MANNERKRWQINNNNDCVTEHEVRASLSRRPIGASARIYPPDRFGAERAKLLLLECGWSYGIESDGALLSVRIMPSLGEVDRLYRVLEAIYGPEGSVHSELAVRAGAFVRSIKSRPDMSVDAPPEAPITVEADDDFGPAEGL